MPGGAGKTDVSEDVKLGMIYAFMIKVHDALAKKELAAESIAQGIVQQHLDLTAIARAVVLTAANDPASQRLVYWTEKLLHQLNRPKPRPGLTQKRRNQIIIAYYQALQAFFSHWNDIQQKMVLDSFKKTTPTGLFDEAKRIFSGMSKDEDDAG